MQLLWAVIKERVPQIIWKILFGVSPEVNPSSWLGSKHQPVKLFGIHQSLAPLPSFSLWRKHGGHSSGFSRGVLFVMFYWLKLPGRLGAQNPLRMCAAFSKARNTTEFHRGVFLFVCLFRMSRTHDPKVASWSLGRSGGRMVCCRVHSLYLLLFGDDSSGMQSTPVILPKVQVAVYTKTGIHLWPNKVGLGCLFCPGIVWTFIRETSSHTASQGTLGHSCLSSLGCCGLTRLKEWNWCVRPDLHFKK